jgi:hypothetical protein
MNRHSVASERVITFLCEASQKIRGRLLAAGSTAIVIFHTGLIPEKIEGLGISFSVKQQTAMIWCLLILLVFLLISFLISSCADFVSARLERRGNIEQALLGIVNEAVEKGREGKQQANAWWSAKSAISNMSKQLHVSPKVVTLIARARFLWDAILPILVAIYAVIVLAIYLKHGAIR